MKRIYLLLFFAIVLLFPSWSAAQSRSDNRTRMQESFADRIWFGGGFTLGFTGSNGISVFTIGVQPMAGYKFSDRLTFGPRAGILADFYSATTFNGNRERANPITWSVGAFGRYKITPNIFGHAEYEFADQALPFVTADALEIVRFRQNNVFLGGGYTAGNFEILALYNVNQQDNDIGFIQSPWIFRFGFTQGF